MIQRHALQLLFSFILFGMLCVTSWAGLVQPVWQWTGLTQPPNHAWAIETLFDAYFGFITFYVWVIYKEQFVAKRVLWFVAIMTLSNMAMAIYILKELAKLESDNDMAQLLVRRND
ncbi:MAG: DUF1475 domain-containing protein [Steroidobacteraceae bacterium]